MAARSFEPSEACSRRLVELTDRLVRELVLFYQMRREQGAAALAKRYGRDVAAAANLELVLGDADVTALVVLAGRALRESGMAIAIELDKQRPADPFEDEPTLPNYQPEPLMPEEEVTPVQRRPRR